MKIIAAIVLEGLNFLFIRWMIHSLDHLEAKILLAAMALAFFAKRLRMYIWSWDG